MANRDPFLDAGPVERINLVLRFVLEVLALVAVVYAGFHRADGFPAILLGIGLPLTMAAAWGIFRVPNDGGPPVIVTPGPARLLLEAIYFGLAVILLAAAGKGTLALVFGVVILLHYAIAWRRTVRLIRNEPL